MTEAEWLAFEDPDPMLQHLQGKWHERMRSLFGLRPFPLSKRKLQLFYCGCSRRLSPEIEGTALEEAVTVAEKYVDRLLPRQQLRQAHQAVLLCPISAPSFWAWRACDSAIRLEGLLRFTTAVQLALLDYVLEAEEDRGNVPVGISRLEIPPTILGAVNQSRCEQARLIRDIFGNPFRPVPRGAAWHTKTVTQLAERVYTDSSFDRLPIVADALEEAGCDRVDVLEHLRGPGTHVRGCWVIDLLTGRK
jgi:hypothetical protein